MKGEGIFGALCVVFIFGLIVGYWTGRRQSRELINIMRERIAFLRKHLGLPEEK